MNLVIEIDALGQPYEVDDLDAAGVLGEFDHAETEDRVAARRKFRLVRRWAELNPGEELSAASWGDGERGPGAGCADPIGGEGSPLVAAEAVPRLGAAMGIGLSTALSWTADVLDVVHRLPLVHGRVEALEVPVWKARRVAVLTRALSAPAARWVDEQLAHRLHEVGVVTIGRVIDAAVAVFHPDRVQPPEGSDKACWRVGFYRPAGMSGANICLDVTGDTLDLTALHDLVCRVAEALRRNGDADSLDQRKAKALGLIGRGDHHDLLAAHPHPDHTTDHPDQPDQGSDSEGSSDAHGAGLVGTGRRWKPRRPGSPTRIYIHLNAADLTPNSEDTAPDSRAGAVRIGQVEGHGPVTVATIRRWAARPGVRIQPVIWMQATDAVDCHDPPAWMADLVRLRDPHCVFPGCQRDSRTCDLDHIDPYRPHGPPGQTHPAALAPLCRGHHNAKTHQGWRYRRLPDGTYLWRAPDDTQYLVNTQSSILVPGG